MAASLPKEQYVSNITLSVDDEIIKQAKLRAVQDGTSLSAKMREFLQRYAMGAELSASPDLSFADNARLFSKDEEPRVGRADRLDPPPLAPNGISVDADYLRSIRGWAREDIYDDPKRHGPWPGKNE